MSSLKHLSLITVVGLSLISLTGCFKTNTTKTIPSPPPPTTTVSPTPPLNTGPGEDPFNATYMIDGQEYTLINGKTERPIPNSSATDTVAIWGQAQYGPLTPNGNQDASVILIQTTGGSGTFYYVAAALESEGSYSGTNAVRLGDRIQLQSHTIDDQTIQVVYVDPASSNSTVSTTTQYEVIEGILSPIKL